MKIWVPDYGSDSHSSDSGNGDAKDHGGREGEVEAGRKLFAHYLWGGALVIADEIERRYRVKKGVSSLEENACGNEREERLWDVEGQEVLELGAGMSNPCANSCLCPCQTPKLGLLSGSCTLHTIYGW